MIRTALFSLMVIAGSGQKTSWQIIAANIGTISTGIDFINATRGYIGLDVNGLGAEVVSSSDAGATWGVAGTSPFGLLFLDVAAFGPNVVVAGVLQLIYSNDYGASFNNSNVTVGAGQCVRVIGTPGHEVGFAVVGDWGLFTEVNGVVVSLDGGASFSTVSDGMSADSRYGAFPTASTWYVTGGTWPGEGADDDFPVDDNNVGYRRSNRRPAVASDYAIPIEADSVIVMTYRHHHVLRGVSSNKLTYAWLNQTAKAARGRLLQSGGWTGQLAKSTDSGQTWADIYNESSSAEFYFNGIECATVDHCCAVAEGDAGTFVYCSSDGGASWNATYNNPDPASSLIDIAALSESEYWAVGMEAGELGPTVAHFVHTVDGGQSWTLFSDIPEQFASAVDCDATSQMCWASMLSLLQETSVAALVATNSSASPALSSLRGRGL